MISGQVPVPSSDPIHDPLLDEYSRDSGLPRETVTQHDPGYERWLMAGAVNFNLDLHVPSQTPPPDYSRDQTQLGAWERANLLFSTRSFAICDHEGQGATEASFVTDVSFEIVQPRFEYFISSHISDNMNDRTLPTDQRIVWRQIHQRIFTHANQHFVRYRQVVDDMREVIRQRLTALPTRRHPAKIPQQALQAYADDLLVYLGARLHYELWRTTCDWENIDYPRLLKGIPNVGGTFTPACGPPPQVPPQPIMPVLVTP